MDRERYIGRERDILVGRGRVRWREMCRERESEVERGISDST